MNKCIFQFLFTLCCVLSLIEAQSLEDRIEGWLITVTDPQAYLPSEHRDILLECAVGHKNSSYAEMTSLSFFGPLSWKEGGVVIKEGIIPDGPFSLNLNISNAGMENYGTYTCSLSINESFTITATTDLLPNGAPQPRIDVVSLSKNSIYTSDCHHNLTRVKFTDGNSLTHHNSLTINMTSSSAQSKLLCHSAEKGLLVITYVLPMGYQPIRFIEPAQLHFCLKHDSHVSIPCTAIGSPLPFTEILDTPRFSSYLTRHSNNSQSFNFKFNDFFDGKSFTCKAANYWEEKNLTFYLGESSDCRTPIEQPTNQTGAFKNLQGRASLEVLPVLKVGDSARLKCRAFSNSTSITLVYLLRKSMNGEETIYWNKFPSNQNEFYHVVEHIVQYVPEDTKEFICRPFSLVGFQSEESRVAVTMTNKSLMEVVHYGPQNVIVRGPSDGIISVNIELKLFPGIAPNLTIINNVEDVSYLQFMQVNTTSRVAVNQTAYLYRDIFDPKRLVNAPFRIKNIVHHTINYTASYNTHILTMLINVTFYPYGDPTATTPTAMIVGMVVGLVLLFVVTIVTVILGLVIWWRKLRHSCILDQNPIIPLIKIEEMKRKELLEKVSRDLAALGMLFGDEHLTLSEEVLGEGAFGVVNKGQLLSHGRPQDVAVKSIKDSTDLESLEEFERELRMLQRVGAHEHIISLVGAVTTENSLLIVIEFASGGRLLSHLRRQVDGLPWLQRINYGIQIAKGMEYLTSRNCVHCDLAARNVLIMEDGTLKVSDFGLARKLYQEVYHKNVTSKTKLPLKWMALESLENFDFNSETDIWSFGVLLWEIATLGKPPFAAVDPLTLLDKLKNGHRLEQPLGCPDSLFTVMRSCWLPNPFDRPNFVQVIAMLGLAQELIANHKDLGPDLEPSTVVNDDPPLVDEENGYCSYCRPNGVAFAERDRVGHNHSMGTLILANSKMAAKRINSGDSGICRIYSSASSLNCNSSGTACYTSELGSSAHSSVTYNRPLHFLCRQPFPRQTSQIKKDASESSV